MLIYKGLKQIGEKITEIHILIKYNKLHRNMRAKAPFSGQGSTCHETFIRNVHKWNRDPHQIKWLVRYFDQFP